MCAVQDGRVYMVVAADSWKARQIADGDEVAVTVPLRRGGVLSLLAPIPPATVSFHARAAVHPAGSVAGTAPARLTRLLPRERRSGSVLELTPVGTFLTYGVGVSLWSMARPSAALAHVPVS